ncbi:MAG: YsnF/AvaK domain-containing protein [Polyangia bacterium]
MTVRTSDGEKLGKIASVNGDEFIIEKGLLFKEDYTARSERVLDVKGDEVIYRPLAEGERAGFTGSEERERQSRTSAGEVRVPLSEEELEVNKRTRETGGVRVSKDVVTENKEMTVPVTHEEVKVERVPAEGRSAAGKIEGGEVTVPTTEEEVTVSKRPVVREEVRVSKQPVQEQRTVSAEVRREEPHIEDLSDDERRARGKSEIEEGGIRAPGRHDENK